MTDFLKVNVDEAHSAEAQQALPVADVGELLRSTRLKRNLSQEEVAHELRIDMRQLDAIENNQFDSFSSPVFVQGYLRNYARLLDLDPEPILNEFRSVSQIKNPEIVPIKKVMTSAGGGSQIPLSKFTPVVLGVVTVLVVIWLGSNLYSFIQEMSDDSSEVAEVEENTETIDVLNRFQEVQERQDTNVADTSEVSEPVQSPRPVVSAIPSVSTTNAVTPSSTPEEVTAAEPVPQAKVSAKFQFNEDSWIEVYDVNNDRLLARIGRAGTAKSIEGVPPLRVVLGNAPGVKVEFEGEPYKVRIRQGAQVARFKLGN